MLKATRAIKEKTNQELCLSTTREMEQIEKMFNNNYAGLTDRLNHILSVKDKGYKEEINTIYDQKENKAAITTRPDLIILKQLIHAEQFEHSTFSRLNTISDIYTVYKQISLLLKRIEFGYVCDMNSYLDSLYEIYGFCQIDVLVVLEAEGK